MKTWIISSLASAMLLGCATNDTGTASRNDPGGSNGVDDQPQTAASGEGSLMPGAFGSRSLPTGQFTGRERTNDQIGQRPTLPREADARELARGEEGLGTGAGTLGQSGVVPNQPVSTDTLLEPSATDEPAASSRQTQLSTQGIGA